MTKEEKSFADSLTEYVGEIIYKLDKVDDPYFGDYESSYNKDDLVVVFKIMRLYKLGVIDRREYYRLLQLYREYLALDGRLDYILYLEHYGITDECYFEYNENTADEIVEKINACEKELEKYNLIPYRIESPYYIDFTIKQNYMTRKM